MSPRSSNRQATFCGCSPSMPRAVGKIRRAPQHEIEALVGRERVRRTEVGVPDVVALDQPVVRGRLACQPHAFLLRLDGHETGPGKPPRGNHADRPDARAEVEHAGRRRRPRRAVPRGEHVVGGETVSLAELKDAEVTADGVERLVAGHIRRRRRTWRDRARLRPALEGRARPRSLVRRAGVHQLQHGREQRAGEHTETPATPPAGR